jgi:two-component system sensor histidine kinase PilS (NtrC family)
LRSTARRKHPHSFLSQDDILTWRPLRQFNHYRFLLALTLLVMFFKDGWLDFLGSQNPQGFLIATLALLASSVLYLTMSIRGRPDLESQVIISNLGDIILISLLAHFSGGLSSSLSILLIINVTSTGTFLRGRNSFVFAALASLAVLSEQTYALLNGTGDATEYTRAGFLGLVFFGTSFLASTLAQQVRKSEQLAKQREADIISLEKLNEDIIQNMRTGIIVVDNDGHIRMANSSAEQLLGNISLQNKPLLENILPALDQRFLEWQGHPGMHHQAIRQGQGLPDIQPGFRALHRNDQQAGDTLIFLEDATQLNQRFQQIKLASLGRLTASIAHEIRNPLSAINHAAQLLQESQLEPGDQKLTGIITTQVQRLDTIVKNVLQLSRQNQGQYEIINLHSWLENFCEEFTRDSQLTAEQINLQCDDKNISISFDSSHLQQIMSNLCSNAISHSQLSRDAVRIQLICGYDEKTAQPYLDIIDNGPGIAEELVEQVFDPFFTTSSKGTGLGLYITKEMVESNRGRIRYIARPQGGCFRLQFLQQVPSLEIEPA